MLIPLEYTSDHSYTQGFLDVQGLRAFCLFSSSCIIPSNSKILPSVINVDGLISRVFANILVLSSDLVSRFTLGPNSMSWALLGIQGTTYFAL